MSGAPVPYDQEAELCVLGSALHSRAALEMFLAETPPPAFYGPGHAMVAQTIETLARRGEPVDPLTVRAHLEAADGNGRSALLVAMGSSMAPLGVARSMAGVVMDRWARRAALPNVVEARRSLLDPTQSLDDIQRGLEAAIDSVGLPTMKTTPALDVDGFLAIVDPPENWVIPGLLERGDRLIVTGTEGSGKSVFARQFGAQVAAGMHPFSGRPILTRRVLIVDLENSERQIRRSMRPIWQELRRQQFVGPASNFRIATRGQGLNLLSSPMDIRWLYAAIEANQPDLLITGPLYKLGATSSKEEEAAAVARILDEIRTRWGCAMLLEAHAPHGDANGPMGRNLRPFGASLWLRWPDFGYGLRWCGEDDPHRFVWAPWRGPREVREWPVALVKSGRAIPWDVLPLDQAKTLERF